MICVLFTLKSVDMNDVDARGVYIPHAPCSLNCRIGRHTVHGRASYLKGLGKVMVWSVVSVCVSVCVCVCVHMLGL